MQAAYGRIDRVSLIGSLALDLGMYAYLQKVPYELAFYSLASTARIQEHFASQLPLV